MVSDAQHGWRLSPSFDLVPNIGENTEHVLFFDLDPKYPGRTNLGKMGDDWGVKNVKEIVDQIFTVVANWQAEFLRYGVSQQDCSRFSEIDTYLSK